MSTATCLLTFEQARKLAMHPVPALRANIRHVDWTLDREFHVLSEPNDFTVNTTTDIVTFSNHSLIDGQQVEIWNVGGGLPGGLSAGRYFVRDIADGDTFKLALTLGGSAIDITTTGAGDHYLQPIMPAGKNRGWLQWDARGFWWMMDVADGSARPMAMGDLTQAEIDGDWTTCDEICLSEGGFGYAPVPQGQFSLLYPNGHLTANTCEPVTQPGNGLVIDPTTGLPADTDAVDSGSSASGGGGSGAGSLGGGGGGGGGASSGSKGAGTGSLAGGGSSGGGGGGGSGGGGNGGGGDKPKKPQENERLYRPVLTINADGSDRNVGSATADALIIASVSLSAVAEGELDREGFYFVRVHVAGRIHNATMRPGQSRSFPSYWLSQKPYAFSATAVATTAGARVGVVISRRDNGSNLVWEDTPL